MVVPATDTPGYFYRYNLVHIIVEEDRNNTPLHCTLFLINREEKRRKKKEMTEARKQEYQIRE